MIFSLEKIRTNPKKILTLIFAVILDIFIVNLSLIISTTIRYIWTVAIRGSFDPYSSLLWHINVYKINAAFLSIIIPILFYLFGIYTYSINYQNKYKLFMIFQAVTFSYLLHSFIIFLFQEFFITHRIVLLISWGLTLILTTSIRIVPDFIFKFYQSNVFANKTTKHVGKERSILVIGGAGYIGSALVPMLLDRGYHVRLFDVFLYGKESIKEFNNHKNLEVIEADFRQIDKLVEAAKGVDSIVHLGAIVGDPACSLDEEITIEINFISTRTIAEIGRSFGIKKFIFASTCSVYGIGEEILNEYSKVNPISLYAKSKLASEKVLLSLTSSSFAPIILRFGTIYGFSGRIRFDLVVNLLTAKAYFEKKITVFGPDQWRPFVHVYDAAKAILLALDAPTSAVKGQIFNVGSNSQNYTLRQVGEIIHKFVPDAELLLYDNNQTDKRNYKVDFHKISNILGFSPSWTIEMGIQQILEKIREGKINNYNDPKYSNVKALEERQKYRLYLLKSKGTNFFVKKYLSLDYEDEAYI